jgi:glycosyltransferase involved in cell wall biosynthesis
MKRIIFDAQVLQTPAIKRGMGQYVLSLLSALEKTNEVSITVVISSYHINDFTAEAKKSLEKFDVVELPLIGLKQTKDTKRAIVVNEDILNKWVTRFESDDCLFIIGSLFQAEIFPAFPKGVCCGAVAYDVIPIQLFKKYAPTMRWGDYLTRFSLMNKADSLFCISKTTANDLQVYANIQPEKIKVINGGPSKLSKQKAPKIKPRKKFILMPTGNDIRKNNFLAVESFAAVNQKLGYEYQLVITSYFTDEEKKSLNKLSQEVVFTGVVSDNELAWYFSKCEMVLFPSLYEGLGMPLIEAMVYKKTIAASSIDVFLEISPNAANFFDPNSITEMSEMIERSIKQKPSNQQLMAAKGVVRDFTWENSAKLLLEHAFSKNNKEKSFNDKKRMVVLGPHTTGSSAIGKFIAGIHPVLSEHFDVDYYYERSPVDKVLRPDILGHIANYRPINELSDKIIKEYDCILYHIGNSNHHSMTLARALKFPGTVIIHDLHIGNVYEDLYDRKLIGKDRLYGERKLDTMLPSKSSFLQSVVNRQKAIVTHSHYSEEVISSITDKNVFRAQLAINTPLFDVSSKNKVFTIGLAGILAGIKGLNTIKWIARHSEFKNDRIKLFGLNFAEAGLLEELRQIPNVEISTDLTDFEFQQNLRHLDILVNFRTKYQGEASYATLEAMRYGVPVIVRGDFGWYSELPNDAVLKADKEDQITELILSVKNNNNKRDMIRRISRETTANEFSAKQYVAVIKKAIEGEL